MKRLRARAESVKFRAEEEAAHTENQRRDAAAEDEERAKNERAFDDHRAAEFVSDFLGEPFGVEQLTRIEVDGWKRAWAFDLVDFGPMQVRENSFFGLRLMDGTRDNGDGRIVRSLADLIEPTSSESRRAHEDWLRRESYQQARLSAPIVAGPMPEASTPWRRLWRWWRG